MQKSQDFENMNWHDNAIHGLSLIEGKDGCSGTLKLDIDYISEWFKPSGNYYSFKIAAADLEFHEVTDLVISIDYKQCSGAFQPMAIQKIHREEVNCENGHSEYSWNIEISWPSNSYISFRSPAFTQIARMEPVVSQAQYLSQEERGK